MEMKRGDVWYVSKDEPMPGETFGRYYVVMTSEIGLSSGSDVICVPITSNMSHVKMSVNTAISCLNRPSMVVGNKVVTMPKEYFRRKDSELSPSELESVETGVLRAMGFITNKETARAMVKGVDVDRLREAEWSADYYKKMYEMTLDKLCESRMPMESVMKPFYVEPMPEPEPEPKVEVVQKQGPVNLNTCSEEDLRNLGFKPNIVQNIIAFRPFKKKDDLRVVPGVTKTAWLIVQHKVEVGAVEEKPKVEEKPAKVEEKPVVVHEISAKPEEDKVNVNTATARELMDLGIGYTAAYSITGYRNKHGRYLCVEDLRNVKQFSRKAFEKLRDKLCV